MLTPRAGRAQISCHQEANMTDDELKNGSALPKDIVAQATPGPQTVQQQYEALQRAIGPIVGTMVRGIMTGLGPFDPTMAMSVIVGCMGAESMRGLMVPHIVAELNTKKLFRESFEEGLKSVKPQYAPMMQPPPGGAFKAN
jgi:hypothetical protein